MTADSKGIIHFIKKSHCPQHTMNFCLDIGLRCLFLPKLIFLTLKCLQIVYSSPFPFIFCMRERKKEERKKGREGRKASKQLRKEREREKEKEGGKDAREEDRKKTLFLKFYPKPPDVCFHDSNKLYSQVLSIANTTVFV